MSEPTDQSEPIIQIPANPPISERAAGKTVNPSKSQYFNLCLTGKSLTQPTTLYSNPSTIPVIVSYKGTGFTSEQ